MATIKILLFDMEDVFCDSDFGYRLNLLGKWTGVLVAEIEQRGFKSVF